MPSLPPRTHGLPPNAIRQIIATAQALDGGHFQQAQGHLAPLLTSYPRHPEVLRLKAGLQGMQGQHAMAVETMRTAIAQRPDDPVYLNTLGSMLGSAGELDSAIDVLRRACHIDPSLGVAWLNLGIMLTRYVRHADALDALHHAVQLDPGNAGARCLLGDLLRVEGRTGESRSTYRAVLAQRPWSGMAWWGLADLRTGALGAGDIAAMRAAVADARATLDEQVATGFALSHALDATGDYPAALSALQHAHGLARRRQIWDRHAFGNHVDTVLAAASALRERDEDAHRGAEVIFVVGLPRSGTTLVEQILASHSTVQGTGELPDLPMVINDESHRRRVPFPQWMAQANADDWRRLGARYLARTAYWRKQKPRFVDKLPINWLNIGAIRAMLPGARIVLCRRDPVETCFSCYRQYMQNNEYTRTFEDLAAYWHDFDRAVAHWQRSPANPIFELVHESLLAEPDAVTRRLLEACDLPFEAACLHFYANERAVRSPSASQVRQPLRRDTRHTPAYGRLLDPLRQALGIGPVAAAP